MPRPPGTDSAVQVRGLVKRYGSVLAVNDVSFTAARGAVTAVLGPNGAGKTTTLETCEGFRRADSGSVRVLGRDPAADGRELQPRIGVMLQSGGIYPGARCAEMLHLVASFCANPLRPEALLDRLGLSPVAGTSYRRLSGGQQQRLGLAMAIVGRPELVFLDEPTAGLDPQARRGTWELIADLRRDGVSVLLSTHYMEEAERLADWVVIVDAGRVVASGTPYELTSGGAERQLRFRAPPGLELDQLLGALPIGTAAKESPSGHYVLEGDIDPAFLASVTAWCASHGVFADDLRVEQRTLEDVFLELTGRGLRT